MISKLQIHKYENLLGCVILYQASPSEPFILKNDIFLRIVFCHLFFSISIGILNFTSFGTHTFNYHNFLYSDLNYPLIQNYPLNVSRKLVNRSPSANVNKKDQLNHTNTKSLSFFFFELANIRSEKFRIIFPDE